MALVASETQTATISTSVVELGDAAFGFDATNLAQAIACVITSNANGINVLERAVPTATTGHPIAQGESARIDGSRNIADCQMIRTGSSDATVTVTLYETEQSFRR